MPNRLIHETSPYLLQHAHNPVDWYPWGPEAFAAAKAQNKPVFLSVGYSTCYWCHVMERESFENDAVAAEMNRQFICIKVDREERPDVDSFYMNAVQVLTHRGGWPMSVFLMPDGRPFHGGTYFPPTDRQGMAGFLTVLGAVDDAWRNRPEQVQRSGEQLMDILREIAEPAAPRKDTTLDGDLVHELLRRSTADYEPTFGGFGSAPKFPRETLLELILVYLSHRTDAKERERLVKQLRHALDAMADGGIRDHLGGGFHRYSTDASWLVPHFEIMLYDNAMLAWVYAEASRQSGTDARAGNGPWQRTAGEGTGSTSAQTRYAQVARGICDFVLREMTSSAGTFYTALDAEVDAKEGEPYLWIANEVTETLAAEDSKLFSRIYGLDQGPNFADPHHGPGVPEKNVLFLPRPLAQVAGDMGISEQSLDARLAPMRAKLLATRNRRKQPSLDTKIITSWNALMIRALAYCGRVLSEPRYVEAATNAAEFLLSTHRQSDGTLWRTSRDGQPQHDAFLDDYAMLAHALLELHEATGEPQWREHAADIADLMISRFADVPLRQKDDPTPDPSSHGLPALPLPQGEGRGEGILPAAPSPLRRSVAPSLPSRAFFFTPADATDLPLRQKLAHDSPLPSGNAIAAIVALKLGRTDISAGILGTFARQIAEQGEGMSSMVTALIEHLAVHTAITVPGVREPERPASPQELADEVVELHAAWPNPRELHILFRIKDGWHIHSNPAAREMIPTQIAVLGDAVPTVAFYKYPDPQELTLAGREIPVFTGEAVLEVHFKGDMTGIGPILLSVVYQPCDDRSCLPETTRQFELNTP
ncbi:MAG: DUF255 domain-containing protein, partial [Tepidisphaeraceae bacterium]